MIDPLKPIKDAIVDAVEKSLPPANERRLPDQITLPRSILSREDIARKLEEIDRRMIDLGAVARDATPRHRLALEIDRVAKAITALRTYLNS